MSIIAPIDQEWLRTGTERGTAYFRGEKPNRVPANPVILGHSALIHNRPIYDFYTKPSLGVEMLLNTQAFYDVPPMCMWLYATYWCEDYGGKIKFPTGHMSAPSIVEYPCKTPEDAEKLEVKSPEEISKGPTMTRHWEALEAAQKLLGPYFIPWQFPYEMFVIAAYWVSPERLFMWVNKKPELAHKMLRKAVEHSVNVNTIVAKKYGSAFIITASLLANSSTMNPKQCREFNIVYLKEMIERSLKAGAGPGIWYHLCGDHKYDWPLHEDIPITPATIMHVAYEGLKPADLTKVIKVFGNKCALLGNVHTALMMRGTPKEVYEEAKRQVLTYKESPKGFILGVACECPPFSPPANIQAFMRAAKDFGKL